MTEFPSTKEITVASSLLLLSYGPVFISPTRSRSVEESSYTSKWCDEGTSNLSLSLGSNGSGSCGSALSNDGSSLGFEIDYAGDRFHLMNLKIARKRRSQVTWGYFNSVNSVCESSCLSTGSSEVRNQKSNEKVRVDVKKKKRKKNESSRSSCIRRRAKDILEFLSSASSSSEVQIRQSLGNTPDTSKALRMLLKMEEVKRVGTGGRLDPYIYKNA